MGLVGSFRVTFDGKGASWRASEVEQRVAQSFQQ